MVYQFKILGLLKTVINIRGRFLLPDLDVCTIDITQST